MTYNTPELLLIGAAQNLVLDGEFASFGDPRCEPRDNHVGGMWESDIPELW